MEMRVEGRELRKSLTPFQLTTMERGMEMKMEKGWTQLKMMGIRGNVAVESWGV
jgi:hypothetical protein